MSQAPTKNPFVLLRSFAINSFVVVAVACAGFAELASRAFVAETIERDAILTAQFIQVFAQAGVLNLGEVSQLGRSHDLNVVQNRDFPQPADNAGASFEVLDRVRADFYDRIARLPGVLLIKVFSAEGAVVWSTAPTLVDQPGGRYAGAIDVLGSSGMEVRAYIRHTGASDVESQFLRTPKNTYVENYIPVLGLGGDVAFVIKLYKESGSLLRTLERGNRLIWGGVVLAGLVVYLALFWFAFDMAQKFRRQQTPLGSEEKIRSA